jgi:hypothetical protein
MGEIWSHHGTPRVDLDKLTGLEFCQIYEQAHHRLSLSLVLKPQLTTGAAPARHVIKAIGNNE